MSTTTKGTSFINTSRIENRPYAGSWKPNFRKVHTWSPDALVYINGDTALIGCQECKNKIDFQPFITSVNVEAGNTSSSSSSSINFSIPKHHGDSIFKDGTFILCVGLEVNVYYRGFFNVQNLVESEIIDYGDEEYDLADLQMKPYYPVFHGVVTSVNYTYSGGFYSGSLSCNGLLHFWQYQHIITQSAALESVPNAQIQPTGHVFTGWTPHQIIKYLFKDRGGAQKNDLGYVINGVSNLSSQGGDELWQQALQYWETRFSQGLYNLRMYGASGNLLTNGANAYIDQLIVNSGSLSPRSQNGLPTMNSQQRVENTLDPRVLRQYDLIEVPLTGTDTEQIQPFTLDVGQVGQFDSYQSTYETKLGIADTVVEKTNWEFFQDVDGDLVFKPPMFNLNVKGNRVYTIKPEDIVDLGFTQKEPNATYVVCKGSMFGNMTGLVDNQQIAPQAQYVDYRLVAKFGWRENQFDATHIKDPKSAFYMASARLDLLNKDVEGCTLTIPLRPELKAGYPIYIEHIDCFYYVEAVSHSFSFGGDCTTSLTLVCRRKKFILPGSSNTSYAQDSSKAVDLANISQPNKYLNSLDTEGNVRVCGFPNVVMAIDQTKINPTSLPSGQDNIEISTPEHLNMLILEAHNAGILQIAPQASSDLNKGNPLFNGPFFVRNPASTDGEGEIIGILDVKDATSQLGTQASISPNNSTNAVQPKDNSIKGNDLSQDQIASNELNVQNQSLPDEIPTTSVDIGQQQSIADKKVTLSQLVDLVKSYRSSNTTAFGQGSKANILANLATRKSTFGGAVAGHYRYYSCSHPDVQMQGAIEISVKKGKVDFKQPPRIEAKPNLKNVNVVMPDPTTANTDGNLIEFVDDPNYVKTGIRIFKNIGQPQEIVPTSEIKGLAFQKIDLEIPTTVITEQTQGTPMGKMTGISYSQIAKIIRDQLFSNGRPLLREKKIGANDPQINKNICEVLFDKDKIDDVNDDIFQAYANGSLCDGDGKSLVGDYIEINGEGIQRILGVAIREWSRDIYDAPVSPDKKGVANALLDPANQKWALTPSKTYLDIYTGRDYRYDCQVAWCGLFAQYCIKESGAIKPSVYDGGFLGGCGGIFSKWGNTARFIDYYKNKNSEIKVGDIVIFNGISSETGAPTETSSKHGTHIALCAEIHQDYIICVDGNSFGLHPDGKEGTGVVKTKRKKDIIWYLYRFLPEDFIPPAQTPKANPNDSVYKIKLNNIVTNLMTKLEKKHSVLTDLKKAKENPQAVQNVFNTQGENIDKLQKDLKILLSLTGGFNLTPSNSLASGAGAYNNDPTVMPVFPVSDEYGYEVFGSYPYGRGLTLRKNGSFEKLLKKDKTSSVNLEDTKEDVAGSELANVTIQESSNTIKNAVNSDANLNKEMSTNIIDSGLANQPVNQTSVDQGLIIESVPKKLQDITPNFDQKGNVCDCRSYDRDLQLLGISLDGAYNYVNVGQEQLVKKMANDNFSKAEVWQSNQSKLIGGGK